MMYTPPERVKIRAQFSCQTPMMMMMTQRRRFILQQTQTKMLANNLLCFVLALVPCRTRCPARRGPLPRASAGRKDGWTCAFYRCCTLASPSTCQALMCAGGFTLVCFARVTVCAFKQRANVTSAVTICCWRDVLNA